MTTPGGTYRIGDKSVKRLGFGAMQLAGRNVFGPPKDRNAAIGILREAVAMGTNHIDTSDYYGPHVTNQLISEALYPYPNDLVIVTKVGAGRGQAGSVHPAMSRYDLTRAVHDNLRNLRLDVLEVVNMRSMISDATPAEGSIEEPVTVLAELQRQGLIRHIGLSNVTPAQVAEGRRICDVVCVQNLFNLFDRTDDALVDQMALDGIAYVAYWPLGGASPLASMELSSLARQVGSTAAQLALAWLLHRSPNILAIPGTSSLTHLRENFATATLELSPDLIRRLDRMNRAGLLQSDH